MKRKEYINEFFVIDSGTSATNATSLEVDVDGYNSITVVNITNKPIIVPFPGGVGLANGQKVTIQGKENQLNRGKMYILFDDIFPPINGQALIIRKKFI